MLKRDKRWWLAAIGVAGLVALLVGWQVSARWASGVMQSETPRYVDEAACQQCHQTQFSDWRRSHHRQAMQVASPETVKGDFTAPPLTNDVETTRFLRKGDEFWVNLPDAQGKSASFRVAYTFGLEPLQQYLLELPGGRLQALGAAWDTQQRRWFHLYPADGVDYRDSLHWSAPQQNANFMCIECHTTAYERRYDPLTQRYGNHWQALGVGCQSCHGPASEHERAARAGQLDKQPGLGFAVSESHRSAVSEVEVCARCHSRRAPLDDGQRTGHSLFDDYLPSQLTAVLNEVDGKIRDEVFEYGAFTQSRMYQAGVSCSDCHNVHSGELKKPGNEVCLQCHNPAGRLVREGIRQGALKSADYQSAQHHHHPQGSEASQCVSCHMPSKVYMGNDRRHDHSFSVPNPMQAQMLGHSDACLGCHQDKQPAELQNAFNNWYPNAQPRDGGYAQALYKARQGLPQAAPALLAQLQRVDLPAIRRAALIAELPRYPSNLAVEAVVRALTQSEPDVRLAAIEALDGLVDPSRQVAVLAPLLGDSRRSVRMAVAWQLLSATEVAPDALPGLRQALQEYEQSQLHQQDRAEANFNLAMLYQLTGRASQVMPSLEVALARDPQFHSARILLAQILEQQQADTALQALRQAVRQAPQEASLRYALGMTLIRTGGRDEGIHQLGQALDLAPERADYAYAYAVGLHDQGRDADAVALLRRQLGRAPGERGLRLLLVGYLSDEGQQAAAQQLLAELKAINPDDPALPAQL